MITANTVIMTTEPTEHEQHGSGFTCDLIIPAYNEIENIDALFAAIEPVRDRFRYIILADNGSTDGTGEAAGARDAVVVREQKRGYGATCLAALQWITSNESGPPAIVAFVDADLSDDPRSLPSVLAPIMSGEVDICIGSRVRLAQPGSLNFVQRFGNRLACTMMHILGGVKYSDLGPMRAVRWRTLNGLQMADRTWGWTVEMQMKAALLQIPITEVDVPYRRRHSGRSKISGTVRGVVTAGTKIITTILALWWGRRTLRARPTL